MPGKTSCFYLPFLKGISMIHLTLGRTMVVIL